MTAQMIYLALTMLQTSKQEVKHQRKTRHPEASAGFCTEHVSAVNYQKKCKHSSSHVNTQTHIGMYVFTPAKVDWISEAHGLCMCTTQCWRAASIMAPSEAEMMDMVCRWEWAPRAWGHCGSTALDPLPSVSTGWAQTHDRGLGQHTPGPPSQTWL